MADFLGTIEKGSLKSFKEYLTSPSISSGTLTIDLSAGSVFGVSHTESITTITISNPVSSNAGSVQAFTLFLTYTAAAYTISWGTIKWPNNTPPTLSTGVGAIDVFTFVTTNGGSNWFGFVAGQKY
jgi:hypothetical protein